MKLFLVAVCLLAPSVVSASPGSGVDLTWNDCIDGTSGTYASNKNFVCTGTENQIYLLLAQFKVNHPIPRAGAWTASLIYENGTGSLGDASTGFWRLEQPCPATGIRGIGMSVTPPSSCTEAGVLDVSEGGGTGVYGLEWQSDSPRPGAARLIAYYARADGYAIEPDANYYLMTFMLNNRNRSGCPDGCTDPGVIFFEELKIESFDRPEEHVSGTDKLSACVSINQGYSCLCAVCDPIAVQGRTWGAIKALYRRSSR